MHRQVDKHPRIRRSLGLILSKTLGEKRVRSTTRNLLRPGDCVWDIGAHIGDYSRMFLQAVGPDGQVVAIDPIPGNIARIRRLASCGRLTMVEAALSDGDGETWFTLSGTTPETNGRSHIGEESDGGLTVRVARGDTLVEEGIARPDVIKIDVEGHEGNVLDGMPSTLGSVRAVVMEMHFAAMTERGAPDEPLRIIDLLRGRGFDVRWIDPSHLVATRRGGLITA